MLDCPLSVGDTEFLFAGIMVLMVVFLSCGIVIGRRFGR